MLKQQGMIKFMGSNKNNRKVSIVGNSSGVCPITLIKLHLGQL